MTKDSTDKNLKRSKSKKGLIVRLDFGLRPEKIEAQGQMIRQALEHDMNDDPQVKKFA